MLPIMYKMYRNVHYSESRSAFWTANCTHLSALRLSNSVGLTGCIEAVSYDVVTVDGVRVLTRLVNPIVGS